MIKLPVEIWDYIFELVGERPRVESCVESLYYPGIGIPHGPKVIVMRPRGRPKDEYEEIIRMLTK